MARAFPPRADCPDVPTIDAIEGELIDINKELKDIPPPAYEYPKFEFPMPNPLQNAFGCYGVSLGASLNRDASGSSISSSSIDPAFDARVVYPSSSETGVCQPFFHFNVKIPPCATISMGGRVSMSQAISSPAMEISGGRDPNRPCASDFEFDFRLPCNTVSLNATVSVESSLSDPEWVVTSSQGAGVCVSLFNMDLRLPRFGEDDVCQARMATTGNVARSGLQIVDGVVGSNGDVVFVRAQTSGSQNGAYIMRAGAWERTCEMRAGIIVTVREGNTYESTSWMLSTDDPIIVGVTPLVFTLISGTACCCFARVATTTNITLSGPQTIDGVSATTGDIVLVKDQTDKEDNGAYQVAAGAWERVCDVVAGHTVSVRGGVTQSRTLWILATDDPITVGTTELTYRQVQDSWRVKLAIRENRALTGTGGAIQYDGVTLSAEDLVLLWGQTDKKENGLWIVKSGSWERFGDIYPGMQIHVSEGSIWGRSVFTLLQNEPVVIGTTELTFGPAFRNVLMVTAVLDKSPYGQPGQNLTGNSPTIDGSALSAGHTVLVNEGPAKAEHGIWVVRSGAWYKAVPATDAFRGHLAVASIGTVYRRGIFAQIGTSSWIGLATFVGYDPSCP